MNERFNTGLVVGKFCPLHRGHQYLIDQALACCDHLVLLSYTQPSLAGCEAARRARWLEALYPQTTILVFDDDILATWCTAQGLPLRTLPINDAADLCQREFAGWIIEHFVRRRIDAVFTSEDYGAGFAQALADRFGHPVAHRCVDRSREAVPISGIRIRADVHAHREWLAPEVYADFVQRIALLGGESSGKSSLAKALAQRLGTVYVPEYGRTLWEARAGDLRYDDLLYIAQTQCAHEQAQAAVAKRWLVCDTTPLTTLCYSLDLYGHADPALWALAERRYDMAFLCAPDFTFVQDGTRRDAAFRQAQHDWHVRELQARSVPYTLLQGPIARRLLCALALM
ncbi:MAG: AAA family ATPase [Pseudomonadales bacterium]|nr:AAA family ATPase [Pseudomonadales bacterium]